MKQKFWLSAGACAVLLAATLLTQGCGGSSSTEVRTTTTTTTTPASNGAAQATPVSAMAHDGATHAGAAHNGAAHVPAHYASAQEMPQLEPTLTPAQFFGQARLAYQAAKEMPQTIAQLPCYCHCDVGFGHKSLHSCFVDDHAAHCAVCVEEALTAARLQKEEKLTPAQIRERIIAQYGETQ